MQPVDFKDTEYYKLYEEHIDMFMKAILEEIINNTDNEIKYTWNDVLKRVFLYIHSELKGRKDSVELNPNAFDKASEKIMKEVTQEAYRMMWIQE